METVFLLIVVVVVLTLAAKLINPHQKPGRKCQSCPEFKRCGGGRPRCARRSENA